MMKNFTNKTDLYLLLFIHNGQTLIYYNTYDLTYPIFTIKKKTNCQMNGGKNYKKIN